MRILALDWGTVRVGAAVSDPDGKIAFPLDKYIDAKLALPEVKKIVDEKKVEMVLVGMPKSLSGNESQSSKQVEQFIEKLKDAIACPINLIDERLSSVGAHKILNEQGLNQKQQKGLVDNLAAQQLLQMYLDTKNN